MHLNMLKKLNMFKTVAPTLNIYYKFRHCSIAFSQINIYKIQINQWFFVGCSRD